MKQIGVLVAVEIRAVLEKYQEQLTKKEEAGFSVYSLQRRDYQLHFVHSGAGLIRAAAAIQILCDRYNIDFLMNFGIVGALVEGLSVGETCLVSRVVHYQMDGSQFDGRPVGRYDGKSDIYLPASQAILQEVSRLYPELPLVTAASGDRFVGRAEDKVQLHEDFGAHICDMESASVVLVSEFNSIPNLMIKTVSDSLHGGAQECIHRSFDTAETCFAIADSVLEAGII